MTSDQLKHSLERARQLGGQESGLAVVVTLRPDGTPHTSVVNAGILKHPLGGQAVVGFVVRGDRKKLANLRTHPFATIVFRSGWDWIAVEGRAEVVGPRDVLEGFDPQGLLGLLRQIYAAAVGGTAEDWTSLNDTITDEQHSGVLVQPDHIYPSAAN
jgi:hypothetical protein